MTDYEHVPCPACHGRGHIPVEEAAKIAGVSIEEARRAGRESEKQEAAELERRVAEAAASRGRADRWVIMAAWPGGCPTGKGSMPRG